MAEKFVQIKERQVYKENPKATYRREQESNRMDDIIKDTIIVSKIDITFKEIEEGLIKDGNLEKEQIAAEYEAIVKKQLQMLQADERGRQALQNEIGEIRRKQEKRAEVLRTRARALEVEKERAKRIANRPPPLPRSVRLLLKEQAKKDLEMASEYVTSNISPLEEDFLEEDMEDKENIDEEYLAERRKMQEEWDKKAKKRFNEALRKDRQKQEHDTILKEIEDAERLNRRQMARNISEPTGKVPCFLPDKLHHAEKQVAMEDAVEDVFKKKNSKEHAVEDLEGYEDKWETKYQQIDSVVESRMLDCVPSFVKENYSYLLQEETTLQCGKRFSGLDDGTDLNEAYIESPPADLLNNSKEIDAVISQLDQMRVELNEAYEKEFKPLLEAAAMPKIVSLDKSVEANILKLPTEDKAVEVERTPPKRETPLSSRDIQDNILQGGVMSFQRRDLGKMYKSHANNSGRYLPESFASQSDTASEVRSPRSALESWSSSSYWSLPSKHGLPKVCKFCDSPGCTIPLVEDEKLHKDCVPLAKSLSKPSDDLTAKTLPVANDSPEELVKTGYSSSEELHSSAIKSKLTSYIQLVADKYLRKSTNSPEAIGTSKEISGISDHASSKLDSKGPTAFSKLKISQHVEISDKRIADTDLVQTPSVTPRSLFQRRSEVDVLIHTRDETGQHEYDHLGLGLVKSSENALLTNMSSSSEDELLQNCRKIIAANLSDAFAAANRFESVTAEVSRSSDQSVSPDVTTEQQYKKESLTGYMYHDLSTIQEMDSALTNDTKELSLNETQGSLGNPLKKSDLEDISPDEVDTTSASLVDAPVSVVSEIAKGIRFIRKPTPEPIEMDDSSKGHVALVSGTLTDFQTPPSVVSKVQTTQYKISSIQSLSDGPVSNIDSTTDAKTSDNGSGTSALLTPSPVSTLKSVSVAKSQGHPYSSSYRDSNATRSHLTSPSVLSKYFQDISSIRHESEASSKGSADAAISVQMDARRETEVHESSSGTFWPMTPHSYVSTQRQTKLHGSSAGTFLPMTPQSNVSTQRQTEVHGSSAGTFLPMTSHSNVSTPGDTTGNQKEQTSTRRTHLSSRQNKNVLGIFKTPESNTGSFKPLTPHSYFSGISKTTTEHPSLNPRPFSPRKDDHYTSHTGVSSQKNIDDSNQDSFKSLPLYSNISTPKDTDVTSNQKISRLSDKTNADSQCESTKSSYFQPMTPHSYISSPSDIHTSRLNEFSTGKEIKRGSVNLRIRLPNPFKNRDASRNHNVQGKSDEPRSFTYPIQLRLDVKDTTNPSENYIMDDARVQSMDSLMKGNPSARQMSSKAPSKNSGVKHITKDKKTIKVPSSGFVPKLTVEDFTSYDRPLHSTNNDVAFSSCKSSLKNSASTINNDLKNVLGKVPYSTSSVENERGYSSPTHDEAFSTSPNPILQALAQLPSSSTKFRTPYATPSNGSSVESLSEMFVDSKITYQSTPIKSIEELIQETGILEEPSLTLMNTEITIKPDSPEKSRLLSEVSSVPSDELRTPSSLQSAFFTPNTLDTPSETASSPYCDSPSMISFLSHEQSCLTSVNVQENRSSAKKSSQDEYKKRTKRLWNNLEEVRTKKLLEEKREQMRMNRLKMKSYSKKGTTPVKK